MIDLDYSAAQLIDALAAYVDLAEFQPRLGSGEACFASERFLPQRKYCCAVFARLKQLTTHPRSRYRHKREAQARQRRMPFDAKETQQMRILADDLSRYELLTPKKRESVLEEVEGYSMFPIPLPLEGGRPDGTVSDNTSSSSV